MIHLRNQAFEKATINKDQLQSMINSVKTSSTKDAASLALNLNMPALLYFILSSNESKYIGAMVIDRNLKKYAILDTKIDRECFNKVKNANNCSADRKIRLIEQCNASAISSTKLHERNLAITNGRTNLDVGLFKNQISEKIKYDTYWFSNLMSDDFINGDLFNKERDIKSNQSEQYTSYTYEHNRNNSRIDLHKIEQSMSEYNAQKDQIIDSLAKIKYGTFEEDLNNSILPFVIFEIIAKSSNGDVLTNSRLLDIQNAKTTLGKTTVDKTTVDNGESQNNTLTNKIAQLEKVVQERIGKYLPLNENDLNDLLARAVKKAFELKEKIKYQFFGSSWSSPEEREILIEDYKQARTLVIILIDKGAKIDKIKPQIDEYKKSKKSDSSEIQKFYERFRILPREVIVFEFMHNIKMFKDRCIFTNTLFYKNYIETSELDFTEQYFFPLLAKEEEILKKIQNKIQQSQQWSIDNQQKHRAANFLTNFFRFIFYGMIDFEKYNNKLKQYKHLQNDAKLNRNFESFFVLADELEESSKDRIWSREHEWFFAHLFEQDKDSIYCKSIATFVSEELNEIYRIRKELEGLEGESRVRKIKEIGGYVKDSNYSMNLHIEAGEKNIIDKNEVCYKTFFKKLFLSMSVAALISIVLMALEVSGLAIGITAGVLGAGSLLLSSFCGLKADKENDQQLS